METHHDPLVSLLSERFIDELPLRIPHFRACIMKLSYQISHIPGKNLVTADVLFRGPSSHISTVNYELKTKVNTYVNAIITSLPATNTKLQEIKVSQQNDPTCKWLTYFCLIG